METRFGMLQFVYEKEQKKPSSTAIVGGMQMVVLNGYLELSDKKIPENSLWKDPRGKF